MGPLLDLNAAPLQLVSRSITPLGFPRNNTTIVIPTIRREKNTGSLRTFRQRFVWGFLHTFLGFWVFFYTLISSYVFFYFVHRLLGVQFPPAPLRGETTETK